MTDRRHFHFLLSCIGERNGHPLQCSCLENPRDGGAWWAAVYGVAQSQTRLKWRSSSSSSRNPLFSSFRFLAAVFTLVSLASLSHVCVIQGLAKHLRKISLANLGRSGYLFYLQFAPLISNLSCNSKLPFLIP